MKEKTSRLLTFLYTTSVGNRLLRILVSPAVSKAAGCVMNSRLSLIAVSGFIKSQNIDVSEFEKTSFSSYNDFFTRKLKPDARLLAQGDDILISPCDAKLTIFPITNDSRFLIKQGQYTVQSLLRDEKLAKQFEGGILWQLRLSVDDYHRYGYVDDGKIVENNYVPGVLHTVRPIALNRYPVFVQNSREYSVIETNNFGTIAQIEVGALMIGKIKNHQKSGLVKKGREKGMFLYGGSTIVVLLEKDKVDIDEKYFRNTVNDIETKVKFGSTIGIKSSD